MTNRTGKKDRAELLRASDAEIEDAVRFTEPMALRGLLYQLTGDESVAATEVTKSRFFFAEAYAPTPAAVAFLQEKTATYLKSLRDRGAPDVPVGALERLPRSLELTAGEPIPRRELDMWIEECALDPWARGLEWAAPPTAEKLAAFSVLVIGAGLGGLNAAVQLKHAGIPFVVIEKNEHVGGTWFENRYPGARVDTPSRAYTHIFGADFVFDHPFSPQADNEKYFNWVADEFGVREHTVFGTEVLSATWNEDAKTWSVVARGPKGETAYTANAIICASGLLARPEVPAIPGAETFAGPAFHTARWPAGLAVEGKRVAIVGSGATGYQLLPELAKIAGTVHLFQRKPQWLFELPGYTSALPPQVTWLDRNLPYHINFMRFRTNWLTGEHVYADIFRIDPKWIDPHTKSELNHRVRNERIAYIREKFASRPELVEKMIPPHPPFSARPLLVDAAHNAYDAILRDNVTLVTEGIERITPKGIIAGGVEHEFDAIVLATGFKANELLSPMEIRGRGGKTVTELWAHDGARAYVAGSMLPGFPNFFMLYGPNTNPAVGGGIVNSEEMVTRFALECIETLFRENKRSVDVRHEAYVRYNRLLDEREAGKIYTDARASNFFMNKHNRSGVMLPFAPSELWNWLRPLNREDLIVE